MCGITGFVGNFTKETLQNMTAAIAHRGPDGDGTWVGDGIGLGHRRLSIIDLSSAASQPMHAVNDRYVVTFNGEIYNFQHLAVELEKHGYNFNLHSDTAILAPLYDLYGEKMLDKLSGIFAFAIWDKQDQKLFAARDHVGIKPFYYTKTNEGIAFASELKALLEVEGLDKSIDENALFSYITYLWCPGEPTLLKGVRKLLPGHYLTACKGHIQIHKWYNLPMPQIEDGEPVYDHNKTPTDLLNLLDEVVKEQMVSDVQVGTFLSGGVDSSAIAASIKAHDKKPLEAFCMKFKGATMQNEGFSEDVEFAREVANQHDIKLNEVSVDNTCLNGLEENGLVFR